MEEDQKVNSDSVSNYYANNIELSSGFYDFILHFGMNFPDGKEKELVKIILSPSNAKVLAIILMKAVKDLEEKAKAKIPVPPQFEE